LSPHKEFLQRSIELAKQAAEQGEVPVGALVTQNNKIIAEAFNQKEQNADASQHAEVLAIQKASKTLGDWRLTGCTLYTSLEPCPMCAGLILQARLKKVIFAAKEPIWGAAGSVVDLFETGKFQHRVETDFIKIPEAESLIKRFFRSA